jgi:hypothetical protein
LPRACTEIVTPAVSSKAAMKVGDGSAFGQGANHNQPWPPTQRPVVCGGETLAREGVTEGERGSGIDER